MVNPLRRFGETQNQVVVLTALETFAETADRVEDRAPVHAQMRGVHSRQERVGRPVRLEERLRPPSLIIDLVLVGVDHVGVRVLVEQQRVLEERVRCEHVVVIQQRYELAGRRSKCAVRRRGDVSVGLAKHQPHPVVALGVLFEHAPHVR